MVEREKLCEAIAHAINYHSLDSRLDMADWQIANLIVDEVILHLKGETDVQLIERVTPEELGH